MNHIRKRIMVITAAVFICCMFIKGQIVYADELSGEIEVLMTLSEYEMRPYLDEFEKKYPNVNVKYTYYQNYEEEVMKRIETGDYGDVLLLPSFMKEDDFSTYLEPIGSLQGLSQKYNFLEQSRRKNGIVYGVPSYAYLSGILYNKEVFDKAGITTLPTSIDEFVEAMKLIKLHTDAIPFYTNYNADFTLQQWEVFPFIDMTGDAGYLSGGYLNDRNPYRKGTTHYKVYRLLYDMVELGYTERNPASCNWNESKKMLNGGKIGCVVIGSWAVSQFRDAGPNEDNIAFMPFPNSIDGKQYMTVMTDYCYAISKNTKNKEAAKAYIEFMLEESGFALEHENLSIVKTDPYPDTYELNDNIVILSNNIANPQSYQLLSELQKDLDLSSSEEIRRIIDAASGKRNESFDDIMDDWNRRWEKNRPESSSVGSSGGEEISGEAFFDNSSVQFSEAEKKYLAEHSELKVGFLQNMAPLSYEMQGYFCGAAYEMCNIVAENTNQSLSYYGYKNTEELVQALLRGEIDMAAGLEKTVEYGEIIKYSKNYLDYYNVLIENETVEADNLTGKTAAIPYGEKNTYWGNIDKKATYGNIGDCVDAVQNLRADYTITNHYSANYYVRERDCEDVSILPYAGTGALCLGFTVNADATLIAICNKCIYSIENGDMEIALIKYMDPSPQKVTIKRFIKTNTLLCFCILFVFFLIIFAAIVIVMIEKDKSNKKHALDVKKYELLASLADEYIFEYDFAKNQVIFDKKFVTTFGFGGTINRNEKRNTNPALMQFLEQLDKSIKHDEEAVRAFCMEKENGEKAWYRLITSEIAGKDGKTGRLVGKLMNVQKEMEEMQSFKNKAERDPLTQLYNRDGFHKKLPEKSSEVLFAVVDIDNFKLINDTLGHTGGDYCLMLLSRQLIGTMGDTAVIGRYGGDEFVVAIMGITEEECKERLELLVQSMDREVRYQENKVGISISLGAVYSKEEIEIDKLFDKADNALYITKESGKNGYHLTALN